MNRLIDKSLHKGIFEGDLRYGRAKGKNNIKGSDFSAGSNPDGTSVNLPVMPLVLVSKRDPEVWKKDPGVKIRKKQLSPYQHATNYLIKAYEESRIQYRSNMHLTIGKQKL